MQAVGDGTLLNMVGCNIINYLTLIVPTVTLWCLSSQSLNQDTDHPSFLHLFLLISLNWEHAVRYLLGVDQGGHPVGSFSLLWVENNR